MAAHPFDDLTPEEIVQVRNLVQDKHPGVLLSFKAITLEEPDKKLMLEYLKAEHAGKTTPFVNRVAFTSFYIRRTVRSFPVCYGGAVRSFTVFLPSSKSC